GGARVSKDDPRVEAYGTVDELNAFLGLARTQGLSGDMDSVLADVQSDLFQLGAELAMAPGQEAKLATTPIDELSVTRLEDAIDRSEAELPALTSFVLPGGTGGAAALHVARTVCRRAERLLIRLSRAESQRPVAVIYLNRLSDLLFSYARLVNHRAQVPDVPWTGARGLARKS